MSGKHIEDKPKHIEAHYLGNEDIVVSNFGLVDRCSRTK